VRAIVQRATWGEVSVGSEVIGRLDPTPGLVILVGVGPDDGEPEALLLAEKIAGLRIFADTKGKMNLSLLEVSGGALVISQFTLYADLRRGRRPGYTGAASPEVASPLVERVIDELRRLGTPVQGGRFGAHMQVRLTNDGPVTISLDTDLWR